MPIDQSVLITKSSLYNEAIFENQHFSKTGSRLKTAFLCHSHRDEALVKGLIALFEESGIELYVDWKDHTMPDIPNVETALKIQTKIMTNDIFLFLATSNSKSSRWCPWEIGYGDSSKKKIYIIPTSDGRDNYGNEYLDLYPKIDTGVYETKRGLALFKPRNKNGSWLTSGIL